MKTPTQNTEHTPDLIRVRAASLVSMSLRQDWTGREPECLRQASDMLKDLSADNQRLREQVAQLTEALFRLTDHAMETHPHFESPRGQEDIGRAIVALGENEAKELGLKSRIAAAVSAYRKSTDIHQSPTLP